MPLERWFDQRHIIPVLLVEREVISGYVQWGHYCGPTHYPLGGGYIDHSWLELTTGHIVDVTRWAIEGTPPNLYIGARGQEYDLWASNWSQSKLVPSWKPSDRAISLELDTSLDTWLKELLGRPPVYSIKHLTWFVDTDPVVFGSHAVDLYEALESNGYGYLLKPENIVKVLETPINTRN